MVIKMIKLSEITSYLENKFPKEYAEEFDNIGLLVGRCERDVNKALICLDISPSVVKEAINIGAQLIITHHPVIFNPLKEISDSTVLGQALVLAIENNISIYSVHTNLDSAPGGLTDYVISKLNLTAFENIEGNLGRICTAPKGETAKSLCDRIKAEFGVNALYSTFSENKEINTVAVCNGGGGGNLAELVVGRCDVYISGDLKHHEHMAMALSSDTDFIEIRHYDSEFPVTTLLKNVLEESFAERLEVLISKTNISPLIDTDNIV